MYRPYTTGKIGKLLSVAPRTVTKWCDSGRLKCYRLPGSTDRRITEEALREFLGTHGMPALETLEAALGTAPAESHAAGILSIG